VCLLFILLKNHLQKKPAGKTEVVQEGETFERRTIDTELTMDVAEWPEYYRCVVTDLIHLPVLVFNAHYYCVEAGRRSCVRS
jgi:hypothetical protein